MGHAVMAHPHGAYGSLFPFLSQVSVGPFRGPFGKEENHLELLICDI